MQTILKKRKACNKYFLPKLFYNHQPSGRKNVNSTTSGLHSRCLMFVQFTSYVQREILYFNSYFMNLRNVLELVVNYVLRLDNEEILHKFSLCLSLSLSVCLSVCLSVSLSLSLSVSLYSFFEYQRFSGPTCHEKYGFRYFQTAKPNIF